MKKAKIMLMAVSVLAIVGASLAFKAVNPTQFSVWTCGAGNVCTVVPTLIGVSNVIGNGFITEVPVQSGTFVDADLAESVCATNDQACGSGVQAYNVYQGEQ